jgi:hypothetical protein
MCLRQMTFTACRALSTGIIRWIASMAPPDAPAVAQLLVEFGHRTALHGGNPYRARAYYKAAAAPAGSRLSRSSTIKSAPKRPAGRPAPSALKMKQR